jgi:phosphoserine phosphatase
VRTENAVRLSSVYFDCDSTLTSIEGIDELVADAEPPLRARIATLTERAMAGELPLADVYAERLRLLAPRADQLDRVGELYVQRVVPDARAVVHALQYVGKRVGIVSGGIHEPVLHLARHLGIADADVHAVRLRFTPAGAYADFDRSVPLWRNGGKVDVLQALPASHHPLAFVGDGITDAETRGHVALFLGFGGVVDRGRVRELADVFVATPSLAGVLPHLLTGDEQRALGSAPELAALLSRPPA